jgi:hypothetical protein
MPLVLMALPAPALDPSWLDAVPTSARIRADIQDTDPGDTAARQAAAMVVLANFVASLAGRRVDERKLTADEQRIYQSLNEEANRVSAGMQTQLNPTGDSANRSYSQWLERFNQYRRDRQFRDEVLERYFSPALIAQRNETESATRAWRQSQRVYESDESPFELWSEEWQQMSADDRFGMVMIGILMLALLAVVSAAEYLPFRFVGKDLRRLRVGLRSHQVDWLTGVIRDYERSDKTTSFSERATYLLASPGQDTWRSTASTTLTESFTVQAEDNSREYQVVSVYPGSTAGPGHFQGAEGNKLTAVGVIPRFRKKQTLIHFQDWTDRISRAPFMMNDNIRGLLGRRHWASIPAWILGIQIGRAFNVPLGPLLGIILCWIAWRFMFNRFRNARLERFRDHEMPRLRRHIEDEVRAAI